MQHTILRQLGVMEINEMCLQSRGCWSYTIMAFSDFEKLSILQPTRHRSYMGYRACAEQTVTLAKVSYRENGQALGYVTQVDHEGYVTVIECVLCRMYVLQSRDFVRAHQRLRFSIH